MNETDVAQWLTAMAASDHMGWEVDKAAGIYGHEITLRAIWMPRMAILQHLPWLGYFAAYAVLFALSAVSLRWVGEDQ